MTLSFADRAKERLAAYKAKVLGVTEDGIWGGNGRAYPHILPAELKALNILPPYREAFWEYQAAQGISLHSDFHHLTSSQAMAFNLFFPAVAEGPAAGPLLVRSLTGSPATVRLPVFEAVPDATEGTNFDLLLNLESEGTIYIEAKFTESGFGTANPDKAHRRKLETIYRPRLSGKVTAQFLEEDEFFKNYQLLRNVAYCQTKHDRVILVVPSDNGTAREQAQRFLSQALAPGFDAVKLVTVEHIASVLAGAPEMQSQRWREHYRLFHDKYLG